MTIASQCPGLGDPWNLTPAVWDMTLAAIGDKLGMESGDESAVQGVMMKQMKRKKLCQKHLAKRM